MRAIRAKKPLDGRKPRYHKILIPICIRGRVLWFVNDSRAVTFAYQSHNLPDLSWFLHQLNDDIQEVLAEGAPGRAPRQPDIATVEAQNPCSSASRSCLTTSRTTPLQERLLPEHQARDQGGPIVGWGQKGVRHLFDLRPAVPHSRSRLRGIVREPGGSHQSLAASSC